MDKPIQFLLDSQKAFQTALGNMPNVDNAKDATLFIRDNVLYCIDELSEMMREIPYNKTWKDYRDFDFEKRAAAAKEEYIDALHFFINIGLALKLTEEEIMYIYKSKHEENYERQKNGYGFNDSEAASKCVACDNAKAAGTYILCDNATSSIIGNAVLCEQCAMAYALKGITVELLANTVGEESESNE